MATTALIKHKDGTAGGYLIGRRHRKGGIKAINVDNDAPLEVESDEVIITRKAVLSDEKHEFNGQQMTNLEILSTINEQGGGVSLMEQGGRTDENYACKCSGRHYHYKGQSLTDREILGKLEEAGYLCSYQDKYDNFCKSYLADYFSTSDESNELIKQRMLGQIKSLKYAILFTSGMQAMILQNQLSALLIQYKCFNYG